MSIVRIRVLFFGVLRDITSLREDAVDVPDASTVSSVFDLYAQRFPPLRDTASSIVLARNQHFAQPSDPIADNDEIAFLPPVSGGSNMPSEDAFLEHIADPSGHFFALTRTPIHARALVDLLQQPSDGAIVTFDGVTRNNTRGRPTRYLEYECYQAMAIQMMAQIGRDIAANPTPDGVISRIGIIHRLGKLEIGEASVVIVVTSPHRKAAFAAALDAINRLKRLVPIWKKEFFEDGEVWVEGEWDDSVTKAL
jgi:MoaE-MoaD fusion protein